MKFAAAERERVGLIARAEVHTHVAGAPVKCSGCERADAVISGLYAAAIEENGADRPCTCERGVAADDRSAARRRAAGDEETAFHDLCVAEEGVRGGQFERA